MKTCRKQRRQRKGQTVKLIEPHWGPVSCPTCVFQASVVHPETKNIGDIYKCGISIYIHWRTGGNGESIESFELRSAVDIVLKKQKRKKK